MLRRDRDPAERELVVECDAFVTGLYAEYLLARSRPVPVWAWTNLLAHGTEQDLHGAVVHGGARVPIAAQLWWSERAYLAGELLDRAASGRPFAACSGSCSRRWSWSSRHDPRCRDGGQFSWCTPCWPASTSVDSRAGLGDAMTEVLPQDVGETPTIEVRVYRRGELIHRELCESEEQAALAVEEWEDVEDVECEVVDDLSSSHPGPEPVEHEPAASPWEDNPQVSESQRERSY